MPTFLSWQEGRHAEAATLGRALLRCGMGLGSPYHLAASLPVDSLRRQILDLSRRGLLRGATGLAALGTLQAVAPRPLAQPRNDLSPFALGVASGDPWPGGMVIWTRLAPEPMQPGGGMPPAPVEVAWEVAEDEGFRRIAARGRALAMPERAHAVHVELSGLPPGRSWHYRFHAAGATSPTGRTRTAPAPGDTPARLRLAQAGCQHYSTASSPPGGTLPRSRISTWSSTTATTSMNSPSGSSAAPRSRPCASMRMARR